MASMENYKARGGVAARLLALIFVLAEAISAFGACRAPHYRRGRILVDKPSEIVLGISIRLEDFAPDRLTCLAGELRRGFPARSVMAEIFSSHQAALHYSPGNVDVPQAAKEAQLKMHGSYTYDAKTHEEYVEILPDGDSWAHRLLPG